MTGFGLMGAASFISGMVTLFWWRGGFSRGGSFIRMDKVMSSHWHFGKWALAAAALSVAAGQIQILLTASMIDLEAAGALRAMQNFTLPLAQLITAISMMALPLLAADFGRGNLQSLRQKGIATSIILTMISIIYVLFVWWLAVPLVELLYGGKYNAYVWLIAPLGFVPIFMAIGTGYSIILRSIQKVHVYIVSGITVGTVGIVSSFYMIRTWGITGSVLSMILTYLVSFITVYILYKMWFPFRIMDENKSDNTLSR